MHVLDSFSQRRKTSKPRDLHIRKISFSGSSLSSASSYSSCSLSSASLSSASISAPSTASSSSSLSPPNSASTARGPRCSPSPAGLDPLALHPTFHPPPRLCERRLLSSPRVHDDADSDDVVSSVVEIKAMEVDDYFGFQLPRRPALPPSRWSESTVASVESSLSDDDDAATVHGSEEDQAKDDDEEEEDRDAIDELIGHYYFQPAKSTVAHQSMPNFSHKRSTMPKRPPIKTLDSLEDFIKRGGWKRRGIVFNQEEVDGEDEAVHPL